MAEKRLWRCCVCNDIHYGLKPPEICPTCRAKNAFCEIDTPEAIGIINQFQKKFDTVEDLISIWSKFAEGQDFKVSEKTEDVILLARGELQNMEKYGFRYCPCRITTGRMEADLKLICPCNFKSQERWREDGECWCGLFVRR
ncbi:MAG: ferredoxin-thioredoxin reductase catalytic domain-containing protein [Methanomassiliicoccales archaeon]